MQRFSAVALFVQNRKLSSAYRRQRYGVAVAAADFEKPLVVLGEQLVGFEFLLEGFRLCSASTR